MAFGQRKIMASRNDIAPNRRPRKAFPTALKSLGDHISFKRLEMGLSQTQLAQILDVPVLRVRQLEKDGEQPTEVERQTLTRVLSMDSGFPPIRGNGTDRVLDHIWSPGPFSETDSGFEQLKRLNE